MHSPSRPSTAPRPLVRLIPQLADDAAQRHGDQPFLMGHTGTGWRTLSYVEAAAQMHAFTALLEREGVRPGDRVAIQSENRPEWGLAYMSVLEAGGIVVPIDVQLKADEVRQILALSGVSRCIVSSRQRPIIEEAIQGLTEGVSLIGLDALEGLPSWPEAQKTFRGETARPERAGPDDLAAVLFTSGTIGRPKGVMLSHANILNNIETVARTIEILPGDRLLSVLPLHHAFECTLGLLCPLRMGASVAYARALKSAELREDLRSAEVTLVLGVPLLWEKMLAGIHRGIGMAPLPRRLLARVLLAVTRLVRETTGARVGRTLLGPVRAAAGLGRIRFFASGAAALPEEVFWGFVDLGLPVIEGYGLTECAPVVSANPTHDPRPGSVGQPLQGIEVRLDRPDPEGHGEILVRGPNVMLGYYKDPATTAEVLRDGWFHTGDLGRWTAEGRLEITGRLKNMIATAAGKKIYPEEIETALCGSPAILEVVVSSGRDARGEREEVHAHVFPDREAIELMAAEEGGTMNDAFVERIVRREVESRCNRLASYKRVKRIIVRREPFPRTTTGKIRRQGLVASAQAPSGKTEDAVA